MSDDELRKSQMGLGLLEDSGVSTVSDDALAVQTAPVKEPRSPQEWVKENLFSTWLNSAITIIFALVIAIVLVRAVRFIFVTANWAVVQTYMKAYMAGSFPLEETWRLWVATYLVAVLAGTSLGSGRRRFTMAPRRAVVAGLFTVAGVVVFLYVVQTGLVRLLVVGVIAAIFGSIAVGRVVGGRARRPLIAAWILLFPVVMILVRGFDGVPPRLWGGFFFNIIAAAVGIFASFPIGIALALGRRSPLPAIRSFSVVFIEIFRGVPLVAWLVFSKYVVDLALPPQLDLPDIIKAFIAMTLFSSAYVGEIVRGGLQGIDRGQYEAARALGLSTTRMTLLIVLPQALRSTIPAMISHFISLFKDTSLFVAIEVTELLATAFRSSSDTRFLLTEKEVLLFAALIFWIVAFSMSRWSQRLEVRLGLGER